MPTVSACFNTIQSIIKQKCNQTPFNVTGEISDYYEPTYNTTYAVLSLTEITTEAIHKLKVYVPIQVLRQTSIQLCNKQIIEVTGALNLYKGSLQIIANSIAIIKNEEQIKKPYPFLTHKKALPDIIASIAIITSVNGKVYGDLINNLKYGQAEVFDTNMQGPTTAADISHQINLINQSQKKYDCICIIRGGGSESDFYGYNGHSLADAIKSSNIPILTAIGHDGNQFLCDQVADNPYFFSTPTSIANYLSNHHDKLLNEYNQRIPKPLSFTQKFGMLPFKKIVLCLIAIYLIYKYLLS
ncbi:exodeoxyribonuclease VII large subunit [Pelosinus sp. IPA-1]|uniref:exodeoxyribonuclease VII large subunit n=1 Tax=Pelosinus sp. IPA-1 TaxID=3029569 RepID=UPI0024361BB6|nr:exodeoxyribonuclease VII large subunit [Pelosinus sp. IPA-1]GMA99146.1 hypothetical protein PIPA1_19460 [Pelosinus sp. IPA-1]